MFVSLAGSLYSPVLIQAAYTDGGVEKPVYWCRVNCRYLLCAVRSLSGLPEGAPWARERGGCVANLGPDRCALALRAGDVGLCSDNATIRTDGKEDSPRCPNAGLFLCAEHVRLLGGATRLPSTGSGPELAEGSSSKSSPLSILMEAKDKRFARASPPGGPRKPVHFAQLGSPGRFAPVMH